MCIFRRKTPKDDSDTMSLNDLSFERKKSTMSDWKSKLASKFKGKTDYEVIDNGEDDGVNIESYKKTSDEFNDPIPIAPMTEPIKRKPMQNGSANGIHHRAVRDDPNKQQISLTTSNKRPTATTGSRGSRTPAVENGRRVSFRVLQNKIFRKKNYIMILYS